MNGQLAESNGQRMEGLQNIETMPPPDSPTAEIIEANTQPTQMSSQCMEMNNSQCIETRFPPDSHTAEIIETSGQLTETNGQHIKKNGQLTEMNGQCIDNIASIDQRLISLANGEGSFDANTEKEETLKTVNINEITSRMADLSEAVRIRSNKLTNLSEEFYREKRFTKVSEIQEEYYTRTESKEIYTTDSSKTETLHSEREVKIGNNKYAEINLEKSEESNHFGHEHHHGTEKHASYQRGEAEEERVIREHLTQTLQSNASTGEIVEEIVRVLKQQKTHDLLCPVCGSCVTRRVILRKRKRTNAVVSIDGWLKEPITEDEETIQATEEESIANPLIEPNIKDGVTEAFGCLSCFAIFYIKGARMLNLKTYFPGDLTCGLGAIILPDYPWGSCSKQTHEGTRMESNVEVDNALLPIIKENDAIIQEVQTKDEDLQGRFTCDLGAIVFPEYPWGICSEQVNDVMDGARMEGDEEVDNEFAPIVKENEVIIHEVQSKDEDLQGSLTCDLGTIVLPKYLWGASSKQVNDVMDGARMEGDEEVGNVLLPTVKENEATIQEVQSKDEDLQGSFTCDLGVFVLPKYPWGTCSKQVNDVMDGIIMEGPGGIHNVTTTNIMNNSEAFNEKVEMLKEDSDESLQLQSPDRIQLDDVLNTGSKTGIYQDGLIQEDSTVENSVEGKGSLGKQDRIIESSLEEKTNYRIYLETSTDTKFLQEDLHAESTMEEKEALIKDDKMVQTTLEEKMSYQYLETGIDTKVFQGITMEDSDRIQDVIAANSVNKSEAFSVTYPRFEVNSDGSLHHQPYDAPITGFKTPILKDGLIQEDSVVENSVEEKGSLGEQDRIIESTLEEKTNYRIYLETSTDSNFFQEDLHVESNMEEKEVLIKDDKMLQTTLEEKMSYQYLETGIDTKVFQGISIEDSDRIQNVIAANSVNKSEAFSVTYPRFEVNSDGSLHHQPYEAPITGLKTAILKGNQHFISGTIKEESGGRDIIRATNNVKESAGFSEKDQILEINLDQSLYHQAYDSIHAEDAPETGLKTGIFQGTMKEESGGIGNATAANNVNESATYSEKDEILEINPDKTLYYRPYDKIQLNDAPKTRNLQGTDFERSTVDATSEQGECSCGLNSVFLPAYPWGTRLSQSGIVEGAVYGGNKQTGDTSIPEGKATKDILKVGQMPGLTSVVFPNYPWGIGSHSEDMHDVPMHDEEVENTSICACGLSSLIVPNYPWGTQIKKPEAIHDDLIEEEKKEELKRDMVCGLASAILPNYPWGLCSRSEHIQDGHQEAKIEADETTKASVSLMNSRDIVEETESIVLEQSMTISGASVHGKAQDSSAEVGVAFVNKVTHPYIEYPPSGKENATQQNEIQEEYLILPDISTHERVDKPTFKKTYSRIPPIAQLNNMTSSDDITTPLLVKTEEVVTDSWMPIEQKNWSNVSNPADQITEYGINFGTHSSIPDEQAKVQTVICDESNPSELCIMMGTTSESTEGTNLNDSESWDILKSIVYGGLEISIGSFGVVSSAAGGKATTRTVVYMGFATLLAGLIMFFHTVMNLFHQNNIQYREAVGKTLRFNGVISIFSYVFFGVLAPLTYVLTFRESDDRDYKFFATAAISLASVILLSAGKAYVFNKSYLSTVFAYAVSGVLTSLVGYLTGQFLSELLEKWGLKDQVDPE